MNENKRYEFDEMNGGGYVVGYSERMSDDISLIFTRLCEVPTKTQAEKVCNELKDLQKKNEQLKKGIIDCIFKGDSLQIFAEEMGLIE